jgi:hypothetical protein
MKRRPKHMRFRPGHGGNPVSRPERRLGSRAVLVAELAGATPGKDRNGPPSKLRVCVTQRSTPR